MKSRLSWNTGLGERQWEKLTSQGGFLEEAKPGLSGEGQVALEGIC